jgi:hypothetical protein
VLLLVAIISFAGFVFVKGSQPMGVVAPIPTDRPLISII